jgi:signal peptidase I
MRHGVDFVDGQRLSEPYLDQGQAKDTRNFGPCTIPPDHVFVMGDNRTNSDDSRFDFDAGDGIDAQGRCSGAISVSSIVGRAFVIVWPPSHIHWLG